jgi:hypothetical protein
MALNLGSGPVSAIRLGAATPSKVMLGTTQVWPVVPVGDPWTPAELPNLVMFSSFDDLANVVLVDGRVSQVADASGFPFTQGNVANQPALTQNGLDKFASVFNTNFLDSSVPFPGGSALTPFALFGNSDSECIGARVENVLHAQLGGWNAVWHFPGSNRVFPGMPQGAITAAVFRLQFGQAVNQVRVWGTTQNSNSGGTTGPTGTAPGWSYGRQFWNPGASPLNLRCFGIVSGVMSDADAERFEGWAAHTFGYAANLPANHPYKTAPPFL